MDGRHKDQLGGQGGDDESLSRGGLAQMAGQEGLKYL